ncbi:MAG: NAD(P)H-dependent oxidoreductase subunit E [Dehalococcoidales bacterium]|nr:NAD(P)H-dependent oxidoreductase subunit E [Dehalococcoidales bacterium]
MTLHVLNEDIKGFETEQQKLELFTELQDILDRNKGKAGATIRILQQAQELCGYLPAPVLDLLSRELNIPLSKLYSILTFYHFFTVVPKGKYVIQVCKGTACYVKGGQKILDALRRDYFLEPGGITDDGRFSLDVVRCLGCCGLSPVIAIGSDVYRKVKPSDLKDILSSYK